MNQETALGAIAMALGMDWGAGKDFRVVPGSGAKRCISGEHVPSTTAPMTW